MRMMHDEITGMSALASRLPSRDAAALANMVITTG
jgi:hypothetical protein